VPPPDVGPCLTVRLLGGVAVVADGRELAGFDSARLRELLARLVLAGGEALDRAALAFALWPDSTETQARTNLRHLLHDLRRALPDTERYVEITPARLRWRSDAPAEVDVLAFLAACGAGDPAAALGHYGGDLLPGAYDDAVLAERERLAGLAADGLRGLVAGAVAAGDDAAALAWGRRLLALDPLAEDAYRTMMEVHARRGERAAALRLYHACVEMLARELDVEPSAATRRAYAALQADAGAGPAPAPAGDDAARARPGPGLVGRAGEWATALATWREAAGGAAWLLLVSGEAGVGKTRLLDELARAVQAAGGRVARARAYETGGRLPWGPVIDWLRTDALQAPVAQLDPAWRSELARLVPELSVPAAPAAGGDAGLFALPGGDALQRRRLLDAVGRALAGGGPVLLTLDDLQWCDEDTIDAVGFVLHTYPGAPVLVAATLRDHEVDATHPALRLVDSLVRDGIAARVALARLDADATAELAGRLTGARVDEPAARRLFAATDGNPLFVVEAVRAGFDGRAEAMPLTPTVQAVIRSRLRRLSPAASQVAEVAATVGRDFTLDELAAATGTDAGELIEPVDELWRLRIIREHRGSYDFGHDLIRQVAADSVSPARRRRLHRDIALGLAAAHADDPGPVSARLARHFAAAALTPEAIAALRAAAAWALEVYALDDAIASLRKALSLLESQAGGPARDALELDLRQELGVPLVARDGYASPAAQEVYERAAALARRLGRPLSPPVRRGLGLAAIMTCRFDLAAAQGAALLEDRADDPTAAVEGHYLSGVSAFWRGDLAASAQHLEAAVRHYRPELGPEHLARYAQDPEAVCLVRLGLTLWFAGEPERGRELADRARAQATALGHPMTRCYVLTYAAMMAAEDGDVAGADALVTEAEALYDRQPIGSFVAVGRMLRAQVDLAADPDGDGRALAEAVDGLRATDQSLHLTYGLTLLARAHLRAGRLGAARDVLAEAEAWTRAHDQHYLDPELGRLARELAATAG
jgi:DNA-binding SARP family transcriptional activator